MPPLLPDLLPGLLPHPGQSVAWDTTENLFIEGDNLEVLGILGAPLAGRVRLICIDPPYNRGVGQVYRDADGRGHEAWVAMMEPRLRAALPLLAPDGTVLIHIDDHEMPRLRLLADRVFGEERFLACLVWKSRQNKDNRPVSGVSVDHEYVLCYGHRLRGSPRDPSRYANPDQDPRGPWTSANMVGLATAERRPNLHHNLVDPATGVDYGCPPMGWRYDRSTLARLVAQDRILWPRQPTGRPRRKVFLADLASPWAGLSTLIGQGIFTRHGSRDLERLLGARVFPFPKPVALARQLLEQGAGEADLVLDFFAGSGTTGHAVWASNAESGTRRRFVLVQRPEPLDPDDPQQRAAALFCDRLGRPRTLAEITKERLRRASEDLRSRAPEPTVDLGFRVYSVAR